MPPTAARALEELRVGLLDRLDDGLVALWAYGAATFPDRPKLLGDVDTHAVLRETPTPHMTASIRDLHDSIARRCEIEWDSWYILEADARRSTPPHHALRPALVDESWALHRAHWLAGQFIGLHGLRPAELVGAPTWHEQLEALESELEYIEQRIDEGMKDEHYAAFITWNACRIMYSLRSRDVVTSKAAAARWAREALPERWAPAIEAAGRVYDGRSATRDLDHLRATLTEIVSAARAELLRSV